MKFNHCLHAVFLKIIFISQYPKFFTFLGVRCVSSVLTRAEEGELYPQIESNRINDVSVITTK